MKLGCENFENENGLLHSAVFLIGHSSCSAFDQVGRIVKLGTLSVSGREFETNCFLCCWLLSGKQYTDL